MKKQYNLKLEKDFKDILEIFIKEKVQFL